MTKQEFKNIEYKEKIKLIKLIVGISVCINIIFDVIAIIAYFDFLKIDFTIANIVLASIIIYPFIISSPFIFYSVYLIKNLNDIYIKKQDLCLNLSINLVFL